MGLSISFGLPTRRSVVLYPFLSGANESFRQVRLSWLCCQQQEEVAPNIFLTGAKANLVYLLNEFADWHRICIIDTEQMLECALGI